MLVKGGPAHQQPPCWRLRLETIIMACESCYAMWISGYRHWTKGKPVVSFPVSKVHGASTGPTWVMSAPGGPHIGPMKLAIRVVIEGLVFAGDYTLCHLPRCAVEITVITLFEHAGTVPNTLKLNAVSSGAHSEPTAVNLTIFSINCSG